MLLTYVGGDYEFLYLGKIQKNSYWLFQFPFRSFSLNKVRNVRVLSKLKFVWNFSISKITVNVTKYYELFLK